MIIVYNSSAKHLCLHLLNFLVDIGNKADVRVLPKPVLQTEWVQMPQPPLAGHIFLLPSYLSALPPLDSFKFINQGLQNFMLCIRSSFTIAEERWIISSLNVSAVVLLVQPNILLACFAARAHR